MECEHGMAVSIRRLLTSAGTLVPASDITGVFPGESMYQYETVRVGRTLAGHGKRHVCLERSYPNRDALDKVTGRSVYTADMILPGMLYAALMTSPHAHARIKTIDTAEAEALPGVHAIVTCFNTPKLKYNSSSRFRGFGIIKNEQVFPETVRFVGDRVAAVAAETEAIAAQALKLIKVDYEVLPHALTFEEAMAEGAFQIHADNPGNICGEKDLRCGDVDAALADADVIVEETMQLQKVAHASMEPHASLASWDGRKMTLWGTIQNVYGFRDVLSELLELPMSRVRVIKPTIGGGFGGKVEMSLEPVACLLSKMAERPVKLVYSRAQCFTSTRTRHRARTKVTIGAKKDGTLTAIRFEELLDAGAYASGSTSILGAQSGKAFMVYNVPSIHFHGTAIFTNTVPGGAMRGYGSPQIQTPLERAMDRLAQKLKMDRVELRAKNLFHPYDDNPHGGSIGNDLGKACMQRASELFAWHKEKNKAQQGILRGWGIACGVHGNTVFPSSMDYSTMTVRVLPDGSIMLYSGCQDLGQGASTLLSQIVAEVLGVHPWNIDLVESDTETTSFDLGTFASRCTWIGGRAAKEAAERMADLLKGEAEKMLQVDKRELVLGGGCIQHRSNPHCKATLAQVATYAQQKSLMGELLTTATHHATCNAASCSVHMAEVEVNAETGSVKVIRYVAVHDVGTPLNPMSLEGQLEGGIQMGLGYALSEECQIDENGAMKNPIFKRYKLFKAEDMPEIKTDFVGDGELQGPFGGKSIGESATVPVSAAVLNAVCDATGCDFHAMPLYPDVILSALRDK